MFLCLSSTQAEYEATNLLAAPGGDFGRMRAGIKADTLLFLFNVDTFMVMGPFVAVGSPGLAIDPEAFGGELQAQVRARPLQSPVMERKLSSRHATGPMTAPEARLLLAKLRGGTAAEAVVQQAWGQPEDHGAAAAPPEPEPKRRRVAAASAEAVAEEGASGPVVVVLEGEEQEAEDGAAAEEWGGEEAEAEAEAAPGAEEPGEEGEAPAAEADEQLQAEEAELEAGVEGAEGAEGEEEPEIEEDPDEFAAVAEAWRSTRGPRSMHFQELPGCGVLAAAAVDFWPLLVGMWLFGALDWEMGQMQKCIVAGTELFLHNSETQALLGPFAAAGVPAKAIVKGAFGGRLSSQVRVVQGSAPPREAKVEGKLRAGPQMPAAVERFRAQLGSGAPLASWSSAASGAAGSGAAAGSAAVPPRAAAAAARTTAARPPSDARAAGAAAAPGSAAAARAKAGRAPAAELAALPAASGSPACSAYLFVCSAATHSECLSLKLLGAPDWDLGQMQRSISPGMELFLFNLESMVLMGPFVAACAPAPGLLPSAFGGKFRSQVKIAQAGAPPREVRLEAKQRSGPLPAERAEALRAALRSGGRAIAAWRIGEASLE
ncbi:unnamed protein product [Prorocentrum cordatum]|uniref:DCD domain-containing protein n=1 Tax=Prorocentrum cordatum TaxID=2364126 RepID=A0ABN9WRG2_9DINO|nr:unnamed protein product [Polarella glacialis]